jgi:DNA repair ATPase RecN
VFPGWLLLLGMMPGATLRRRALLLMRLQLGKESISGSEKVFLGREERLRGAADKLLNRKRRLGIFKNITSGENELAEEKSEHVIPVKELSRNCGGVERSQAQPQRRLRKTHARLPQPRGDTREYHVENAHFQHELEHARRTAGGKDLVHFLGDPLPRAFQQ